MGILGQALGLLLVRITDMPCSALVQLFNGAILGMDMASAFVEFLAGKEFAGFVRAGIELGVKNQEDDEFAELHGLV